MARSTGSSLSATNYSMEECKLISSVLSADHKVISCLSIPTLEQFYTHLITHVENHKLSQKSPKTLKPPWWPKKLYYDCSLKNIKLRSELQSTKYRSVIVRILRHLVKFYMVNFNVVSPWSNFQDVDMLTRKRKAKKPVVKIKASNLFMTSKQKLSAFVQNKQVLKCNGNLMRKMDTTFFKTPYVKLEDISSLIKNDVSLQLPQKLSQEDFMKVLQLQPKEAVSSVKKTYIKLRSTKYMKNVPLSSLLGSMILKKREAEFPEQYKLTKIRRIEHYLKGVKDVQTDLTVTTRSSLYKKSNLLDNKKTLTKCKECYVRLEYMSAQILNRHLKEGMVLLTNSKLDHSK